MAVSKACDVHDLTTKGGDKTPRDVLYYRCCNAWMCEECARDKPRRARAAIERARRRFMEGLGLGGKR